MNFHNPYDSRTQLKLSEDQQKKLDFYIQKAKNTGMWDIPYIHDPDEFTLERGAYFIYKSLYPITKPEKNSKLENYFSHEQQKSKNLLPENFQIKKKITISAVGDLMNAYGLKNSKNILYENVEDKIFDVDISIANLESTLTKKQVDSHSLSTDDMPKINASLEEYETLKGHNNKKYTIFHLANNHILDCGLEGFETTHDKIKEDGIKFFGTNLNQSEAEKGLILNINNIKIGLIGFTYSVNNRKCPPDKPFLVNRIPFHSLKSTIDLSPIFQQIHFCKNQNCDFIIASLHWGMEYEFYPLLKQMDMAKEIVETGVDLIISHHAHVPQMFELYQTKRDPNRIVPILYGLGNLVGVYSQPHNVLSLISNFELVKGKFSINNQKNTYISNIELIPVFLMEYGKENNYYLKLEKLSDILALIEQKKKDSTTKHPIFDTHVLKEEEVLTYINSINHYAKLILGENWNIKDK